MNAYCELYIYKNCQIQPQRNFKVDDIEDYLLTLDTYNRKVSNVPVAIKGQFMKNQLKLTYKVVFEQGTLLSFSSQSDLSYETTFNYNYLKAVNVDTKATQTGNLRTATPVYYFIVNKRWTSQNALELELEMDVVNTMLKDIDTNSPFTKKSFIVRRHKNRWEKVSGQVNKYSPIIDYVSEGINPLLFKKRECPLYYQKQSGDVDARSWYLIYRSQTTSENSPIEIMCCSDTDFITAQGINGYNGTKDIKKDLGSAKGWIILGSDGTGNPLHNNVGASITIKDKNGASHTLEITSTNTCVVLGTKDIYYGTISSDGLYVEKTYKMGLFKNFRDVDFRKVYAVRLDPVSPPSAFNQGDTIHWFTSSYITDLPLDTSFITAYTSYTICSIDDIDRTDPKLLKIVKLPYPPFDMEIVDNEIIIPAGWEIRQAETEGGEIVFPEILLYSDSSLVNAFSTSFTPTSNYLTDFQPFEVFRNKTINDFGTAVLYDSSYETKLYHSDFYKQKLVYDSFTYDVNAELYKVSSVNSLNCELEFSITATMNSKMMFRIKGITNFSSYKSEVGDIQDYSGLLYIARNNELPVFNSAYLNYIRTGYNYDIKTKNRQLTSNIIGGVLSTTGAVVSAVAGGPVGIAGAIGLGVGAVSMFSKAIVSTAQAEQNIVQKLKSSEMQGLSVAGSDDVDLMSIYTDENKLKYVRYEVSANMKEAISNLFYYCGYVANYNDYPDSYISSRMWFNFVQFDPAYVNDYNYPQELVDKLSEKCREGITFLHHNQITINNETIAKYWDFNQVYENWEVLS